MTQPIILDPYARNMRWKLREDARRAPEPWRWPLPKIGEHQPRVIGVQASEDRRSVDIGYGAVVAAPTTLVPVYAAQTGEVAAAMETASGYAVSIDHGQRSWQTHYAHLAQIIVTPCRPRLRRRQLVSAGAVIGYAARSPLHVRFELWQWDDARGFVALDPTPHMPSWELISSPPRPIGFAVKEAA